MNSTFFAAAVRRAVPVAALALLLSACATTPQVTCSMPQSRNLDQAIEYSKAQLIQGCEANFERYYTNLLDIAEGDPTPENKQSFSNFFVWVSDQGILSRRQAQQMYNRYFNVKFVSLLGDYNNCQSTCPRQSQVLQQMEHELSDKELGLLKISMDRGSYYRADRLFKQTELVLAATCQACDLDAPSP